jgi:hypothetical protein
MTMPYRTTFLLLTLGLALSPIGYAQPAKVSVVAVESTDDFKSWLGKPIDPVRAASAGAYPGRLGKLPFGRETQLPIVVSGLQTPAAQEMRLVADVEILGSDGRSLGTSPQCCRATIARGSNERAVLLPSTVVIEPEKGHRQGSYTVRVSVTDGTQTWTASEVLPYGETDMPGSGHEAPRLRMNVPPSQAEPGGPGDKRDCLSLPTPAEVIKCSERKK